MIAISQDTPIRRASIADLNIEQLTALVEEMQERRMRQHTLFEAAQQAKAKNKEEKDRARYTKLLEMADKKIKSVDAAMDTIMKYLNEMKVLELVLGS